MKLTAIIIAAIFTLQVSNVLAGNTENKNSSYCDFPCSSNIMLAPITPSEANFEDESILTDFAELAPGTPMEATFDEFLDSSLPVMNINLAPVTPNEAGFNDEIFTFDFIALAPVTPSEADF